MGWKKKKENNSNLSYFNTFIIYKCTHTHDVNTFVYFLSEGMYARNDALIVYMYVYIQYLVKPINKSRILYPIRVRVKCAARISLQLMPFPCVHQRLILFLILMIKKKSEACPSLHQGVICDPACQSNTIIKQLIQ